jgi:glycosyltransferase 2 family protein
VSRPLLLRLLGAALVVAAAGWLAHTIAGNWQELRGFEWRARPLRLTASVFAHVAVLSWGVWVWRRVLRHFGYGALPLSTLLRIWFVSNLARYVPGKIFQFVAVAQLSRGAGLSAGVLLTSVLVHVGFSLLSAMVVAAWALGTVLVPAGGAAWVAAAATAGALAAVHPAVLNTLLGVVPRILRRPVIRWSGGWLDGVVLLALSVVNWAFYGVAFFLLVSALADVSWRLLPEMAGVNALSFVIGYVSLLPGGLGLREVAMTELLRPYLPGGVAAVLAIASRLWTIAAELLGAAIALAVSRGRPPSAVEAERST